MQKARIDDRGTEFAYIDSGAPQGSTNYSTVVIVHGHTYHAQNFSRLLPLSTEYNLRVIALNRRDYVGSTPFSPSELEDLHSNDEAKHNKFLRDRGLEIARFLVWVINKLDVPPRSITVTNGTSRSYGGISLLGWSLGNITTIEFLSNLKTYPQEVIDKLQPYINAFFLYECSYAICGYPHPDGGYHPLADPDIPQRMKGVYFGSWLSSYFNHPYHDINATGKHPLRSLASLELRIPPIHTKRPTNENISPSELLEMVDIAPGTRSENAYYGTVKQETIYAKFKEAMLLDEGDEPVSSPKLLPSVKVVNIYGTQSMWSVQYGVWKVEDDLEKWKAKSRHTRPFGFVKVDGGNHFIHWDDPREFMRIISEVMST